MFDRMRDEIGDKFILRLPSEILLEIVKLTLKEGHVVGERRSCHETDVLIFV